MPLLLPSLSTVVTAAPGTGSTSLLEACARDDDVVDLLEGVDCVAVGLDAKHATLAGIARSGACREVRATLGSPPAHVVTTTRDPFDFYVAEWHRTRTRWALELDDPSSWVHRVEGMHERIDRALGSDFDPWLRDELAGGPDDGSRRLNPGHVDEATIVLRIEHVDDDLRRLHPRLAERIGPIPHVNRTERDGSSRERYTPWGRAAVERAHAADLARFGYRF